MFSILKLPLWMLLLHSHSIEPELTKCFSTFSQHWNCNHKRFHYLLLALKDVKISILRLIDCNSSIRDYNTRHENQDYKLWYSRLQYNIWHSILQIVSFRITSHVMIFKYPYMIDYNTSCDIQDDKLCHSKMQDMTSKITSCDIQKYKIWHSRQ